MRRACVTSTTTTVILSLSASACRTVHHFEAESHGELVRQVLLPQEVTDPTLEAASVGQSTQLVTAAGATLGPFAGRPARRDDTLLVRAGDGGEQRFTLADVREVRLEEASVVTEPLRATGTSVAPNPFAAGVALVVGTVLAATGVLLMLTTDSSDP